MRYILHLYNIIRR